MPTDAKFCSKTASISYDTFVVIILEEGQTQSIIRIATADAWISCVIKAFRRCLKAVGRFPPVLERCILFSIRVVPDLRYLHLSNYRNPHVLKTKYNAPLPFATANPQVGCLPSFCLALPTDGDMLAQLSTELKVYYATHFIPYTLSRQFRRYYTTYVHRRIFSYHTYFILQRIQWLSTSYRTSGIDPLHIMTFPAHGLCPGLCRRFRKIMPCPVSMCLPPFLRNTSALRRSVGTACKHGRFSPTFTASATYPTYHDMVIPTSHTLRPGRNHISITAPEQSCAPTFVVWIILCLHLHVAMYPFHALYNKLLVQSLSLWHVLRLCYTCTLWHPYTNRKWFSTRICSVIPLHYPSSSFPPYAIFLSFLFWSQFYTVSDDIPGFHLTYDSLHPSAKLSVILPTFFNCSTPYYPRLHTLC